MSSYLTRNYHQPPVADPDLRETRKVLRRISLRTSSDLLDQVIRLGKGSVAEDASAYGFSEPERAALHYLLWSRKGADCEIESYTKSFAKWHRNPASNSDLIEVAQWRTRVRHFPVTPLVIRGDVSLHLHAAFGLAEIKAAFGIADLNSSGPTGTGVIHLESQRTYLHLVTFRKEERDFAPTTRYKDYLISRSRLHWESQAGATQVSKAGGNYIHFQERDYTILFFARLDKRIDGETAPFLFLGPAARLCSYEGDRPIFMIWDLAHPVPAEMFEAARFV